MEVVLDLFNMFSDDARVVDVQQLIGPHRQVHQDGRGNFSIQEKKQVSQKGGYDNRHLEARRQRALAVLGDRYLLHPANQVKREVISISARSGK